ncbi:hypothetical protein V1508DRAFT_359999 [Lipomyces doorenjongii]|uniref:uncharacterized protein n=1 Tax=Lipomyces doorenjongii TaxID=383834 RepID=UPI0034CE8D22
MAQFLNAYTISAFAALEGMFIGFDIYSILGIIGTEQYKIYFKSPLLVRAKVFVFGSLL